MNTYKRHRFPPHIISYAVWLCYRFNLSPRDFEDLLADGVGQGDRARAYAEPDGGLYRAGGSKLKKGKGFLKPNFGVGPNS